MALATSFGTQGAVSNPFGLTSQTTPQISGSTPAAKALGNAAGGSFASTLMGRQTPSVTPAPPPTNQPIKKQTINNVDGSSHITEYHPPTQTTPGLINTNPQKPIPIQQDNTTQPTQNNATNASGGGVQIGNPELNPDYNYPSNPNPNPNNLPASQLNLQSNPTFPGLIGGLTNIATQGTPQYNQALTGYKQAVDNLAQFNQNLQSQEANMETKPGQVGVTAGREAVLERTAAAKQAALQGAINQEQTALTQAQTAQGQQIGALGTAAGLVSPTQVPYSNQYLNPQTGQPIGGGAIGQLPPEAQTYINSLAEQVKNGYMTRADAESRISQYSQPGLQALNSALGQSFNTNASNASGATTAQGQQIQTQTKTANDALDTLSTSFSALSGLQTGGIPASNSIAQWIGTELGDAALNKYKTNLADARAQLVGVLNTAGGTPTGNEATALQYLPDNMTPAMFEQNVGTSEKPGIIRTLMQQKVKQFTTSGLQNSNATTNSNIWNW